MRMSSAWHNQGQVTQAQHLCERSGGIYLYYGRDPEPTPMPWEPGLNAGFTTGTSWLPLADDFDPTRPRRRGGRRHAGVATR